MTNPTRIQRGRSQSRQGGGDRLLSLLPLVISITVGACGYAYGYGVLNANLAAQEKKNVDQDIQIGQMTATISKLGTFDYRLNENAKNINNFLSSMDTFLEAQGRINTQLVLMNSRQTMILKKLGE